MKSVITGLKPTGELTLGNYIGAIKPMMKMQEEYDNIYLFVADLHAITVTQNPADLKDRIKKFIAMYIACGIDPKKVTIYIQSENIYIPAISWLLECYTYYGEASRMIQFKEKSRENENFTVGLLTYPILMSADILYCDRTCAPSFCAAASGSPFVDEYNLYNIALLYRVGYGNIYTSVFLVKDGFR